MDGARKHQIAALQLTLRIEDCTLLRRIHGYQTLVYVATVPSFYSGSQVQAYLQRINFCDDPKLSPFCPNFKNLEQLVRLHPIAFPFENTRLYYSASHDVDVSPEFVYDQRVETGLEHKGRKEQNYLVDVGYGGTGLVRPILLEIGHIVSGAAPPEGHRIMRDMHPESSLQESGATRNWVLQYRCGSRQPDWLTLYLFEEGESLPSDWMAYSQWFNAHPVERQRDNMMCICHFAVDDEHERDKTHASEAPLGRLVMLGRRVQRRVGIYSKTLREFSTEHKKVHNLKENFGVIVNPEDIQHIAHRQAAL